MIDKIINKQISSFTVKSKSTTAKYSLVNNQWWYKIPQCSNQIAISDKTLNNYLTDNQQGLVII